MTKDIWKQYTDHLQILFDKELDKVDSDSQSDLLRFIKNFDLFDDITRPKEVTKQIIKNQFIKEVHESHERINNEISGIRKLSFLKSKHKKVELQDLTFYCLQNMYDIREFFEWVNYSGHKKEWEDIETLFGRKIEAEEWVE